MEKITPITQYDCVNAIHVIKNYFANGHVNTIHDIIVYSDTLKRLIENAGEEMEKAYGPYPYK